MQNIMLRPLSRHVNSGNGSCKSKSTYNVLNILPTSETHARPSLSRHKSLLVTVLSRELWSLGGKPTLSACKTELVLVRFVSNA